jgi:Zn-dependent protease
MLLFGDFSIYALVAIAMVLLFGMGWHEYAHAIVADWWGDPTPREHNRLTPNPIVHIDWIGWAMFLFLGFGILGSVPVNPNRMRDPRWGSFWTSAAGPISNLVQAALFGLLLRFMGDPNYAFRLLFDPQVDVGQFNAPLVDFLLLMGAVGVFFNVLLFVFNLMPFAPLDGWRMILAILPGQFLHHKDIPAFIQENIPPLAAFLRRPAYKWQQWQQVSMYVFFGLIMISFAIPQLNVFGALIFDPTFRLTMLLGGF